MLWCTIFKTDNTGQYRLKVAFMQKTLECIPKLVKTDKTDKTDKRQKQLACARAYLI